MSKVHKRGEIMNIKTLRKKRGLTQSELAEKLKVSQTCVAKWETTDTLPRADKLLEIAKILNCTVDELLK